MLESERSLTTARRSLTPQLPNPNFARGTMMPRLKEWCMGKLDPLLRGRKDAMVLIGASHLPGEDGLLRLLGAAGFSVEQMYGVDQP